MEWLNSITKSASGLTVGWVDFVAILVIVVGIMRGRKRGLSEEILDLVMWISILAACSFFYHRLSDVLATKPMFSKLTYYILSYLLIALVVKIIFTLIKQKFGAKIVESDMFGRLEFYGGMTAGAVRFTCVFLFVIAILNAPYYSPEFLAQRAKDVDYNFGSDFFPHPSKIQKAVFTDSFTGTSLAKHFPTVLIERTEGKSSSVRDDRSLGKRKEREMDAMLGRR